MFLCRTGFRSCSLLPLSLFIVVLNGFCRVSSHLHLRFLLLRRRCGLSSSLICSILHSGPIYRILQIFFLWRDIQAVWTSWLRRICCGPVVSSSGSVRFVLYFSLVYVSNFLFFFCFWGFVQFFVHVLMYCVCNGFYGHVAFSDFLFLFIVPCGFSY